MDAAIASLKGVDDGWITKHSQDLQKKITQFYAELLHKDKGFVFKDDMVIQSEAAKRTWDAFTPFLKNSRRTADHLLGYETLTDAEKVTLDRIRANGRPSLIPNPENAAGSRKNRGSDYRDGNKHVDLWGDPNMLSRWPAPNWVKSLEKHATVWDETIVDFSHVSDNVRADIRNAIAKLPEGLRVKIAIFGE